jgi:hypothetical protein
VLKLVAGLGTLAIPLVVCAAAGPMEAMFSRADQVYASRGLRRTGWSRQGTLAAGDEAVVKLELSGSSFYVVTGLCDASCKNLDLELLDRKGRMLASDHRSDDFPLITAQSGTYRMRVQMIKCALRKCYYGLRTYVKDAVN